MQRAGEYLGVAREDFGRSVSLVHVAVQYNCPANEPRTLDDANRDCHVIKDTESLASVGSGMVGAASQVHGKTLLQCGLGREDRPPRGAGGSFDQFGRPRKADPPLLQRGEFTREHTVDVLVGMHRASSCRVAGGASLSCTPSRSADPATCS